MKGPLTLYTPNNHIKLSKCLKENSVWIYENDAIELTLYRTLKTYIQLQHP